MTMGKCLSFAGMMFVVALLFVSPAKADSFDTYTLTGNGLSITFTLPATLTPSSATWNGSINLHNEKGAHKVSALFISTCKSGIRTQHSSQDPRLTPRLGKTLCLQNFQDFLVSFERWNQVRPC